MSIPVRIRYVGIALLAAMLLAAAAPGLTQAPAPPKWVMPLLQQSRSPITPRPSDQQAIWQGPSGQSVRVVVQAPRLPEDAPRLELAPPPSGEDAGPMLDEALARLRAAGGGRLSLAPGRYVIEHVDRRRACHLCIEDLHDVEIDGDGAELAFSQNSDGIVIARSQRVRLSGLTLRYALRTSSIGRIVEQDGRKLLQLDAGGDPGDEVHQMVQFDPKLGRWPSTGKRLLFPTGDARTPRRIAQGLYSSDAFSTLETGLRFSVHHQWYGGIAVRALDTRGPNQDEDLTLARLDIDNTPGMGIVGYGVKRGFAVLDSRVGPASGGCERLSTAYDSIQIQLVTGDILIRNNRLACSGDDAININSPVHPIIGQTGPGELRIGQYSRFIRAGDDLALFDRQNRWQASVRVSREPVALGGLDYKVSIEGTLPDADGPLFARDQQLATMRYAITDNQIGPCACNAVLAQAPHGLIRNNRVVGASHAAIKLLSNTGTFKEGVGAFDVLVEHNTISESGMSLQSRLGNGDWGAISVYGLGPSNVHAGPTNTDVRIDANSVDGTDQACIVVTSTWRVQLVKNRCKDTNRGRAGPSLRFSYSNAIRLEGNVRTGRSTGGLAIDDTNGTDVQTQTDY